MFFLIILFFIIVFFGVSIILDVFGFARSRYKSMLNRLFGSSEKSDRNKSGRTGNKGNNTTVRTESAVNKGKKKIKADQGEYIDYTNV